MNANEEDEEIVVLEDLPPGFIRPDAEIINVDEDSTTKENSAGNEKIKESQSLMVDMRKHLNTILNEWTKYNQGEQGYDAIRSWRSLTPQDVKLLITKFKTKGEVGSENPSSSSYIQLINKIAVNICLEHHDDILSIIQEFADKKSTQQNSVVNSKAVSTRDHSANARQERKRESESTLKSPSSKKKNMGATVTSKTDYGNISEEEKAFLDNLPVEVKQMFRQICFVKWSKDWVPVLVLNPYDVPQKEFRKEWMKKYKKYSEQKSNKYMEHLFMWYGCKSDSEAYGWAKNKELMSYEEAKKRGLTAIPKKIAERQTTGKTLTKGEQQMVEGFIEAENAIELSLADRCNRHSNQIYGSDSDKVSYKSDEEEQLSEYENDTCHHSKPKRQNCANKENEKEKEKGRNAASANRHEKVKINEAKRKYSVLQEKAEFYQNEEEILPIMHKLNDAVEKKDREKTFSLLDEIKLAVPKIAPSFVELHGIGLLIKKTRKAFGDTEVRPKTKTITDAMKWVYNDKVDRRPQNFKLTWKACDTKLKQEETKIVLKKSAAFNDSDEIDSIFGSNSE